MPCDLKIDLLSGYLDGELRAEQMADVHSHMLGCGSCVATLAQLMRTQRGVRELRGHMAPTADFRQRVQSQVRGRSARGGVPLWTRYIMIAAAMATLLLAITFTVARSERAASFAEVTDLHVGALASTHPLDVVSSDHHTVKPWFEGRIPFTFNLPDFTGSEFTLLGGRVVYFEQQPAAQLLIGYRKHQISVLILRAADLTRASLPTGDTLVDREGFHIETWQEADLRYMIVSDSDAKTVRSLSALFQVLK